jgi:hypothetical protein
VNSIFGEGVNPLMRKIRDGLTKVGFPTDELLRHGNSRVVYCLPLAENFRIEAFRQNQGKGGGLPAPCRPEG